MPGPYSSYITAVQGVYFETLSPILFPGGSRPPLFLDLATATGTDGARQVPPYVLMFDEGSENQWTFKATPNNLVDPTGSNAIVRSGFRLEAYDYDLGDCDKIIATILWNGQTPNQRAGLAFASLSLLSPQKGIPAQVVPTRSQRQYAGIQLNNQRVHVTRQWFRLSTAISGDGL